MFFYTKHEQITEKIIQAFYKVFNTLGYGFLEKVYENAMYIELTLLGFKIIWGFEALKHFSTFVQALRCYLLIR